VIFMGLLIGTMFTLFVVPMFYTLLSRPDRAADARPGPALAEPAE
jgi:multidrug efflux pump